MEDKNYLTLIKEDGSEVKAEILFTCHSDEFSKDFVVFMPEDADGGVAAASFSEDGESTGSLEPITDPNEWKFVEEVLEQYLESIEKDGCSGCSSCCDGCDGCCDCDGDCDGECSK